MAESSHPRLSQCLTLHFSCFASFCYNNTVIISIAIFWGLWVILVNYQTWGSSGNPWVCRHLVRSWGTLGTSKLVTDVWGEGGLMEDCELNLWSLAQLQVVGIRSLCTHSQESSVSESEDRDESEKAKVKTIRSKPYFIFPTEAPIFSKLWPSKNPHQWHLLWLRVKPVLNSWLLSFSSSHISFISRSFRVHPESDLTPSLRGPCPPQFSCALLQ